MYFSGVHFNILNLFKVSIGKFFAQDIEATLQTSDKTHSERTGYDQVNDIPVRLQFCSDIQSGYEDQRFFPGQRHIRSLTTIITYDPFGGTHQGFGFKGMYVDRYG